MAWDKSGTSLGQVVECVQLANAAGLTFGFRGDVGTGQGDDGTTFSDFVCTALTMVGVGPGPVTAHHHRSDRRPRPRRQQSSSVQFHLTWAYALVNIR